MRIQYFFFFICIFIPATIFGQLATKDSKLPFNPETIVLDWTPFQSYAPDEMDNIVDSIYNSLELNDSLDLQGIYKTLKMGDIHKAIDWNEIFRRLDWNEVLGEVDWNYMMKDLNYNEMVDAMCSGNQLTPGQLNLPDSVNAPAQVMAGFNPMSMMNCFQMDMGKMMQAIDMPCFLTKMREGKVPMMGSSMNTSMESFCELRECIDFNKFFEGVDWNCFFKGMDLNIVFRNIDYNVWIEQAMQYSTQGQDSIIQKEIAKNPTLKQVDISKLQEQIFFNPDSLRSTEVAAIYKNLYNKILSGEVLEEADPGYFKNILLISFSMMKNVFGESRALRHYFVHQWLLYEAGHTIRNFQFQDAYKVMQVQKALLANAFQERLFDQLKSEMGNVRAIVGRLYEISNLAGICQELAMVSSQLGRHQEAIESLKLAVEIREGIKENLPTSVSLEDILNQSISDRDAEAIQKQINFEIDSVVLKQMHLELLYSKHPRIIEHLIEKDSFETALKVYLIIKDKLLEDSRANKVRADYTIKNRLLDRAYALKMIKNVYDNMAVVLDSLGEISSDRRTAYQEARPRLEKFEEDQWLVVLFTQMGQTYSLTQEYDYSLEYLLKAWELAKDIENLDYVVVAYPGTEASEKEFLNKMPLFVNIVQNIAKIHIERKNYAAAIEILEEGKVVLMQKENIANFEKGSTDYENNLFRIYGTLGEIYTLKKDTLMAQKNFRACKNIIDNANSEVLQLSYLLYQGNYHQFFRKPKQALSFFKQSLSVAQKLDYQTGEATALAKIGITYHQLGDYENARKFYQKAEEVAEQLQHFPLLLELYYLKGSIAEAEAKPEEALSWYERGIKVVENGIFSYFQGASSKQKTLENAAICYEGAIAIALKTGQQEKAFQFVQQTKARTFNELLIEGTLQGQSGISDKLSNLISEKSKIISHLNRIAGKTEVTDQADAPSQEELLRQLAFISANIKEEVSRISGQEFKIPTIEEVQQTLSSGDVVVEYFMGRNTTAFIIGKTFYEVVAIDSLDENSGLFSNYSNRLDRIISQIALGQRPIIELAAFDKINMRELYKSIWAPVAKSGFLEGASKLVLIPDASLYQVPFESLIGQDSGNTLLLNQFEITYSPSTTTIYNSRKNPKKEIAYKKEVLVVAKSSFEEYENGYNIKFSDIPIPDAAIFDTGGIKEVDFWLEQEAHVDTLMNRGLGGYRYIYFSTHGEIDSIVQLSYLALDQIPLRLYQTFGLNMDCEVAILSACETGRGEFLRGAGVMGFTRSLLSAGAGSLVVSLWKVEVEATDHLMRFFFKNLGAGQKPAQALANAKQELRTFENGKYKNPYYWAPFILFGN